MMNKPRRTSWSVLLVATNSAAALVLKLLRSLMTTLGILRTIISHGTDGRLEAMTGPQTAPPAAFAVHAVRNCREDERDALDFAGRALPGAQARTPVTGSGTVAGSATTAAGTTPPLRALPHAQHQRQMRPDVAITYAEIAVVVAWDQGAPTVANEAPSADALRHPEILRRQMACEPNRDEANVRRPTGPESTKASSPSPNLAASATRSTSDL